MKTGATREVEEEAPENSISSVFSWVGFLSHPFFICIPSLWVVLRPYGAESAGILLWTALALLVPQAAVFLALRAQGRALWMRSARFPAFATFLVSVAVCLAVFWGYARYRFALGGLLLWLPPQIAINSLLTKVSTHTAVNAGVVTGFYLLGDLPSVPLAVLYVALVGLSRVQTRNHTTPQVLLGAAIGCLSILASSLFF